MSSPTPERAGSTRRTVVAAAGAAGLTAALAACGGGGGGGGGAGGAGGAGKPLAKTSEIPTGGGRVFKAQKVVVTQPAKGEFKGFSAVCVHAGCVVGDVSDGTINCPCHGSKFAIADGSVRHGPATRSLPVKHLKVEGGEIELA
ncbi:Rieske (2Fe-2S) protein [Streptomyces sclerotialus]|uniref:Rieske (2Fe-2S) protein n=1 Tax=Streptomyces sclerotialus TaxID=1957 RepID=UPI0004CADC80